MEKLVIEATKSSPYICLDPRGHSLEIKGESYPENFAAFYKPLFTHLQEYLALEVSEPFEVTLEIIYFNSSSSKVLMNLFEMLDASAEDGRKIVVNWRYHEENDTALECGEEFMEDVNAITFNLVKIPAVES